MKHARRRSRCQATRTPSGAALGLLALALGLAACGGDELDRVDDPPNQTPAPGDTTGPPVPPRPMAPAPAPTPTPMPAPAPPVTPPVTDPTPMMPTPMPPASMDPTPSGPFKSPVEGDDTFADLNRPGPVITIAGDQDYQGYKLMTWEEGTKIDARTAIWKSHMACPSRATCTSVAKNSYPIQLGADWVDTFPKRVDLYNRGTCPDPVKEKVYWLGGVILGTAPLNISWDVSKNNNGGGMTMNAIGHVLDGVRLHNLHDPYVPLEGNDFILKNSWITYSRDDAIENDAFASGLIEDNLIEGFYYFYSCTNAGGLDKGPNAFAPGGGGNTITTIKNNLIAFVPMNGFNGSAWGGLWKDWDRSPSGSRSPKIDFIDNIVYVPPKGRSQCELTPTRPNKVQGNILVDMLGCGGANGFKVMRGAEGQAFWDKAKADWIARHPLVGRIEGDPGYKEYMAGLEGSGTANP